MNDQQGSIKSAIAVANILWPEFAVVDDCVFFTWAAPADVDLAQWHDRTEAEQFLNHTHVLDLFRGDVILDGEWNQSHPDFLAACVFGKTWAEAVASKLSRDFPEHSFFVYYTEQDNPVIRFHQIHQGEIPWLQAEDRQDEITTGSIVIHEVRGHDNSSRPAPDGEV